MSLQIVEVLPKIFRLEIPIPVPLKFVNVYLFKSTHGWSIVDCGFHNSETEEIWRAAFAQLGIRGDEVEQIVVTHYHPDHYGGAGWLQQCTGAPVKMLNIEVEWIDRMWKCPEYPEQIGQFFQKNGMPEHLVELVVEEHTGRYEEVSPHPIITTVFDNDKIRIGDYVFRIIWTPGHTEGLMVLWDENNRLLLSNDMVLPKITPNISLNPNSRANPLQDYLRSLEKIEHLPAETTLPGHRGVIENLAERIRELKSHHAERIQRVYSVVRQLSTENGITNAWEVCLALFGPFSDVVQNKFAMAETLAHIEYLVFEGKISKHSDKTIGYAVQTRLR